MLHIFTVNEQACIHEHGYIYEHESNYPNTTCPEDADPTIK